MCRRWLCGALIAPICLATAAATPVVTPLAAPVANEASLPQPPCAVRPPSPAYPAVDQPPNVSVWLEGDELSAWSPPPCTGWSAKRASLLLGIAARFHHAGEVDAFVARWAATSAFRSIEYWSASRQRWRNLFDEAYALSGPDPAARRTDFDPTELQVGRELFLLQDENGPIGEVVQRLTVRERASDRLVLEIENVSPGRLLMLSLIAAGDAQILIFLERHDAGSWNYYSLVRLSKVATVIDPARARSYVNRAVGLFRHIAGLPTDREPPLAP